MATKHKKSESSPYVEKKPQPKGHKSHLEATLKTLETYVAKKGPSKGHKGASNVNALVNGLHEIGSKLLTTSQPEPETAIEVPRGRRGAPKSKRGEKESEQLLSKSKAKASNAPEEDRNLHTSNSPDMKLLMNEILHKIQKEGVSSTWNDEEKKNCEDNRSDDEGGVFSGEVSRIWLSNPNSSRPSEDNQHSFFSTEETGSFPSSRKASVLSLYSPSYLLYTDTNPLQTNLQMLPTEGGYPIRRGYDIMYDNVERDGRTTVMVRNIPNKYSLKLLSEEIDAKFANQYDFLYLPNDFNNNCNVGYAFINFLEPIFLRDFYSHFHNKRWAKFRSEKICILTYARLQGRNSLIEHFYNSKVLNQKAKPYRPIIRDLSKIKDLVKQQRKQEDK